MDIQSRFLRTLAIMLALVVTTSTINAQSIAGRIAFGIDAGGNKYYGNYTDNQFAFHGDAFIRWNILDELSLHAAYNGGQLKYKAKTLGSIADELLAYPTSTASPGIDGTVNHTRVGGWDLMFSYNFFPDQTFVPYVIAGIEALNFEPNDASDNNLRGNATATYSKNVVGGVLGVGFEMYISDKITFNGKGLLHLTGTDWLDDYSYEPTHRQDAFVTMGLGFSYYIFAPPVNHTGDVDTRAANVTNNNITNNTYTTTLVRTDTVVIAGPTDTLYLHSSPKINTIYNFPGTLFIVNSDQFNDAVLNNMGNLYNIKSLIDQCPNLQVEIQGHASDEGSPERNQELSQLRAERVRAWLIDKGVNPSKISAAVGYGTSMNAVQEPTNGTPAQLEAARVLNRRISVKVVRACN